MTGSVPIGLSDWELDSRLLLTAAERTNTPNSPPSMALAVKDPVWIPRRTADVASLIGWEMARAVNHDTKPLDAADTECRVETGINAMRSPSSVGKAKPPRSARQPAPRSPTPIARVLPGGR